jgi:TonB family protein
MISNSVFSIAISALFLAPVIPGSSAQNSAANGVKKRVAIYAPRPKFERGWPEGTGVFVLNVAKTGVVINAQILKSTGYKILDESAVETLKRWRFQRGSPQQITVPMSFVHWEHFKRRGDRGDAGLI